MTNFITDFPRGVCDITQKEDGNPAIQFFGRRFTGEQQVIELLSEFLLVLASKKEIREKSFDDSFPSWDDLLEWDFGDVLNYYPQPKLNLKLFSFLGSSRLETRHETHRLHCQDLWNSLKNKIYADEDQKDDVLITLSNLFLGFWGNGAQRTWCAQNFLPFCKGVLGGELIWNETAAKKMEDLNTWGDVIENFQTLFSQNQHRFLARGGELLYLQFQLFHLLFYLIFFQLVQIHQLMQILEILNLLLLLFLNLLAQSRLYLIQQYLPVQVL